MAFQRGYVTDLFGGRRHLPGAKSENRMKEERALRQASNFPVQSTGNNFCLLSMCLLMILIEETEIDAVVVSTVHDSLIVECAEHCLEDAVELMTEAMLNHNKQEYWRNKPVPMKVDIKYGRNLYEMGAYG